MSERVAIYCRVSDKGATDDYGMPAQERECRAYAARQGWEVVAVYHEWHTGRELFERPEMTRLREAMKRREFDVLLVDRLDRISRDGDHRGYVRTEARYANVAIDSATETIDESSAGRLLHAAFDFKAEEDHATIVRNLARAKREKVTTGKPLGQGKAPFGLLFRTEPDKRGRPRTVGYMEDAATIRHLRRIFAACDEGQSLRAIAKGLEDDGILPPYHARTGSTRWSASTVRAILRDRVYVGEAEAFRTESFRVRDETRGCTVRRHRARPATERVALPAGVAPIVIAPDVFARVQARLDQNRERATNFRTTRYPEVGILRRGLAFCGLCGAKLVVVTTRGVSSYRCQGRERTGCPSAVTIPVAQVDDAVWEWLGAVLSDEDRVRRNIARVATIRRLTIWRPSISSAPSWSASKRTSSRSSPSWRVRTRRGRSLRS